MRSSPAGSPSASIEDLAHGSTVATNAVLERKGFPTAFVTTQGFRDILALQRHGRSRIYDLEYQKPKPVVTRAASFEVAERILADGTVETPLDVADVRRRLVPALKAGAYEAVAICLLNAFVNPSHESGAARAPGQGPARSARHDLLRHHARVPRIRARLDDHAVGLRAAGRSTATSHRFRQRLDGGGVPRSLLGHAVERWTAAGGGDARQRHQCAAVGSRGGRGRRRAPGGPLGLRQSRHARHRRHLDGRVRGDGRRAAADAGVSARRAADPHSPSRHQHDRRRRRIDRVGRRGRHAARRSSLGGRRSGACLLRPRRQPSQPSPTRMSCAARCAPRHSSAGACRSMPTAAARALEPIAQRFGLTLEAAADSAVALANANIVRAIQLISTERGHDPRDYVLVPYGGAGPLHAAKVAEELGIATIVVPPSAGIISAYGLIASDFVLFESMTRQGAVADERRRRGAARGVWRRCAAGPSSAPEQAGSEGRLVFSLTAEMRFVGQAFEVPVPFEEAELESAERRGRATRGSARRTSASISSAGRRQNPSNSCPSASASWHRCEELPLLAQAKAAATPRASDPQSSTARPGTTLTSCAAARSHGTSPYRARR